MRKIERMTIREEFTNWYRIARLFHRKFMRSGRPADQWPRELGRFPLAYAGKKALCDREFRQEMLRDQRCHLRLSRLRSQRQRLSERALP